MDGQINLSIAHERQALFRAEAADARLAMSVRHLRVPARQRLAKLIVAIGYVVVGAGHRLDSAGGSRDRRRLRAVS
jgi:hypothetical protein